MSYTVKKLAKLSGVSIRTLHFYDDIGLLKPAYYGDNKYRYYKKEQLLMLQQILFFRELGFPINDIKKVICSDDFNKIEALNSHKAILKNNIDRQNDLILTIDKTIAYLRGKAKMNNKELFYGLDSETAKRYEQDLINSGWVTEENLEQSREMVKHWTNEDWEEFKNKSDELYKEFVIAMKEKIEADSPKVQRLVRKHYQVIIEPFWEPDKKHYLGLTEIYQMPEFQKFYNRYHPNLLEFLIQSMKVFAEQLD